MTTDALNRRLRWAKPNAHVRRLVITPADLRMFEAIRAHGPLPTNYLFEFTKALRRDYSHLQNRLTELYNGDGSGARYLLRPPQQFDAFAARYQPLVYDLAPRAHQLLAEHDGIESGARQRSDPFVHQFMGACVGATFELTASSLGLRYISCREIVNGPRCTEVARGSMTPTAIDWPGMPGRSLLPDGLFGLEYPNRGFRFFAVEVDRATESIERSNADTSSFGRKVLAYAALLDRQTFRERWGIPNLTVLTVTTSAAHARNVCAFIRRKIDTRLQDRFAFQVASQFGSHWQVPQKVLAYLLEGEWVTACGPRTFY